ncbi:MAG: pyrroline-5-carboxylate reductase [Burkholderiaceae bacterium]
MRITFIGGGNMASALIGGLLARRHSPTDFCVVDPQASTRDGLHTRFGVRTAPAPDADALATDVVLLAVKPQQMQQAAESLAPLMDAQLVISVAAGIRIGDLARWLGGHDRIVRAMPNTPALIGAGITGLAASGSVDAAQREAAQSILDAVGQSVWVDDESQIDAITAVSGSGPAYVFHFIEAIEQGAIALGLPPEQARQLAIATFTGAARLAAESDEPPAVLRERVTSKGGTTAAALAVMAQRGVAAHIGEAMAAARQRSIELGDELGKANG